MPYQPAQDRYDGRMPYRRCGKSGLLLPAISLGCWHNYGEVDVFDTFRSMTRRAFDLGITHFDLANNYGPPPGSAEENFGRILAKDLMPFRDELVISSKAGYFMWPGPYGDHGSRKYLTASLDQSLRRLGLDYVDIFYSHLPDPHTPIEETMGALAQAVRQGKALYAGISSYDAGQTRVATAAARSMGLALLIHQPVYNLFDRWIEGGLQTVLDAEGMGTIAFCPLAQGLLTNRYINGIPDDSRAGRPTGFLKPEAVTRKTLARVKKLNKLAAARGQSLAQMALAWVLRDGKVTSALIGASKVSQIEENVAALNNLSFSKAELDSINAACQFKANSILR
jgi:L-glyceraldehyde 3-phosphate reductase